LRIRDGTTVANAEQLQILQLGAAAWNEWRARNRHETVDLAGADLMGASLVGCDMTRANVTMMTLGHTTLGSSKTLGAAIGLSMIIHDSKSFIDLDAIDGHVVSLPDEFLLGVGCEKEEVEAFR